MDKVKLVVFTPLTHADAVRCAIHAAGGGVIGNYDYCSFSSIGIGRFKGNEHSTPAIGEKGQIEQVEEERIEITVSKAILHDVITAMKKSHPYEEVAYDVYPLLDI